MKTLVHRGNEIWENQSLASFWRFLFLVLLCLYGSAPAVWAQTKQWDKTLGGNATEDFTSMIVTPDGGYLLGGTSTSGVSGDKTQTSRGQADYWIVKVNSSGNIVWNKTI